MEMSSRELFSPSKIDVFVCTFPFDRKMTIIFNANYYTTCCLFSLIVHTLCQQSTDFRHHILHSIFVHEKYFSRLFCSALPSPVPVLRDFGVTV